MRWPLRVLVDGDAMWAPHGWCFVLLRMDLCCLLRRSLTHSKGASRDQVMSVGDNKDKEEPKVVGQTFIGVSASWAPDNRHIKQTPARARPTLSQARLQQE